MKWLARVFASAVVRRAAVLLVAAVVGALGIRQARAAVYPDQGTAYQACMTENTGGTYCASMAEGSNERGIASLTCPLATYNANSQMYRQRVVCNGGKAATFSTPEYVFPKAKTCASRTGDGDGPPSSSNAILVGTGETCYNGCAYGAPLGEGTTRWSFSAGQTVSYVSGGTRVPTGATCNAGGGEYPSPQSEHCAKVGDLTQCLQSDGRHCAVSSTGKRFCWRPKETGTKVSGNEAATKSPEGVTINAPPTAPKNNGQWEQKGSGTASATQGSTTNNYNVTNYESNYGTDGSGGGAEGEGDGGDGGGGDDGNDPGSAGGDVGDLYTPTDKTMHSIVQNWWGQGPGTPLLGPTNAFFGNCSYSGTCPTWSYDTEYTGALVFSQLCDGTLADILFFAGYVVMAMGAFAAFRIAIY